MPVGAVVISPYLIGGWKLWEVHPAWVIGGWGPSNVLFDGSASSDGPGRGSDSVHVSWSGDREDDVDVMGRLDVCLKGLSGCGMCAVGMEVWVLMVDLRKCGLEERRKGRREHEGQINRLGLRAGRKARASGIGRPKRV